MTDQKIRRGVHKSVQALEADIRQWIDHWNENRSYSPGSRPLNETVTPGLNIC